MTCSKCATKSLLAFINFCLASEHVFSRSDKAWLPSFFLIDKVFQCSAISDAQTVRSNIIGIRAPTFFLTHALQLCAHPFLWRCLWFWTTMRWHLGGTRR